MATLRVNWRDNSPEGGRVSRSKMASASRALAFVLLICCGLAPASPAPAQSAPPNVRLTTPATAADRVDPQEGADSASELAKKLQNPIADLINVPFQNNVNFHYGPNKGTQDILNIQPVVPFHLSGNWNLITRTIVPVIWQPSLQPAQTVPQGLGPTVFSAFLSPTRTFDGWVFGGDPVVQIPTATSKTLGSNIWGAGPAVVAVHIGGAFVYGA
jgi:hypothetical protein